MLSSAAEFAGDLRAAAPDMTVEVRNHGDGSLVCKVSSPHIPDYADGKPMAWPLNQNAEEFVTEMMNEFVVAQTTKQRLLALKGAGLELYKRTPENFKDLLWKLIKADRLKTVYVITDEPAYPWELLIPFPEDDPTAQREPLGVEFTVGRWITNRWVSPPQRVPLNKSLIIYPPFNEAGADQLAVEEAQEVSKTIPGDRVDPATSDNVDAELSKKLPDLLHFICHGSAGTAKGRQTLLLADKTELDSMRIAAMDGFKQLFHARHPLIFLNACEVGRLEQALTGVGGFAEAFASLKASAVIAPLWSVKHQAARDAAAEFYRRVRKEPDVPLADFIRDLRRKTYRGDSATLGEDTFAAYCFYGDPLCVTDNAPSDATKPR
jgi:hypothetical protein